MSQTDAVIEYKLRDEQQKAVEQAKAYFKNHTEEDAEFLWNAKPRFGKTLSAYDLCKQLDAKTVLIVTHRPAIATSWYSDYEKFLGTQSGYYFISQADALKDKPSVVKRENLPASARKYIEFVSLQDLKGAIEFGGKYDKLNHISKLKWDLLIIDEAHEGIDTYRADVALDNIHRKYTLHLSGTPFKALANAKFESEAIYNWTYADEQKAKNEWNPSNEEENPYATLPKLNLYTYQMSSIIADKLKQGADFNDDGENENYAFDLNEFFATKSDGNFLHDNDVDKFLDALVSQTKFPFSTPELRDELRHTFWLLNRVDSAKALKKKLNTHPIFKDYHVVLAAGDGKINEDEFIETQKSYNKVLEAIKSCDKTITLSVGQLTTGITIPEWTAVLMLSNVNSPSLYMQAAFRAQNPCLFHYGQQQFRKENAYVFDFDPARTLVIFEQFANDLSSTTSAGKGSIDERKQHIRELINFFPVYGEDDDGEMITLDAEKVLTIPRKIHAQEVVRKGFMCNFLFQNIGNIFNAPQEASSTTEKEQINHKFDKEKLASQDKFLEEMKTAIEELPKTFGETVVKAVETDSKQREKNSIEDGVRDHLRGFSRTIPSFLMAYGNENTTLENFDTIIPDEVFKEVTSISLEEFRFLRDGGDYVDEQAGETKHFEGQLFDPVVFNDSVKEFLSLKTKLGNYFDEKQTEDIFDYIPPQKTNQIYTPKKVVIEMVDMLEQENPNCFDDENKTFIDLYMKSGLYITEIVKRLYRSEKLKKLYPDRIERLKHIFEKQVYGLAPTEIIYRIAIAFILGFDDTILIKKHNLRQFDTLPSVQAGTLETDLDEVFG